MSREAGIARRGPVVVAGLPGDNRCGRPEPYRAVLLGVGRGTVLACQCRRSLRQLDGAHPDAYADHAAEFWLTVAATLGGPFGRRCGTSRFGRPRALAPSTEGTT
ncbi:hypothetical protein [Streptomyces echinatus]|uniref:hypothetical protein n=1 Tax=Streptomyces echinatus TaxID=67293 RepID=UPI0037B46849